MKRYRTAGRISARKSRASLADQRQQRAEAERLRRLHGPEARPVVHVEGYRHARCLRLATGAPQDGPQIVAKGSRDAREVYHPRPADERPLHLLGHELAHRRIAPIVEHPHGTRRDAILEEVQSHAAPGATEDTGAVDAVTGELAHRSVAPRVVGGQSRDERCPEAEPRHGRHDVGLGAADLDIERDGLIKTLGWRRGQAEHDLAQPDQIVAHQDSIRGRSRGAP